MRTLSQMKSPQTQSMLLLCNCLLRICAGVQRAESEWAWWWCCHDDIHTGQHTPVSCAWSEHACTGQVASKPASTVSMHL